jgi:undecaprenyl-diphosphatase
MTLTLVALILGLVEGVTEFLPVSSTGHLIIAGRLLGFEGPKASTFEIFIQLGAILAIVVLERRRFLALLVSDPAEPFSGPRGIGLLFLTTLPILIAGFLLHDVIKTYLFGTKTVAVGLFLGGVLILIVEQFLPAPTIATVDGIGWRTALAIGLFQCLALWPGMSRAGSTIVGGLLCGLERRTAARYSFLAAVPAMAAATLYDLFKSRSLLDASDVPIFAIGFVVSFFAAWAAVRTFLALLGRFTLRPFAWYRIAVTPAVLLVR